MVINRLLAACGRLKPQFKRDDKSFLKKKISKKQK